MKKEILIRGRSIVYFEEGDGFPFLIIHGWGTGAVERFLPFQKILAGRGYRVILLALPGFGENEADPPKWGMRDYLDCITGFVNELGLEKLFLVGHSMGGAIAIRLAVSLPEKIKIIVLLSPGIIRPAKSSFWKWWAFLLGLFLFFRKNRKMSDILKRIAVAENTVLYLAEIKQPTVVFWGKRDYNYYLFGRGAANRIPNGLIYVIPGAGHSLQEDAPEEIIKLITDFIKKQESLD